MTIQNNALQRCLHCEVVTLREREFPLQPVEQTMHDLLEVIADYISGCDCIVEQQRLMEVARTMMMRNFVGIIDGTYKRESAPLRAH